MPKFSPSVTTRLQFKEMKENYHPTANKMSRAYTQSLFQGKRLPRRSVVNPVNIKTRNGIKYFCG